MRILHLDTGREMRGGQWQVLHLLGGLRESGCEVELMAPEDAPLFERAVEAGFAVTPYSAWRVAARARGFDLVHAHDARSHSVAALVSGRPLVVSRRVAFPVRPGVLSRWKYRRPALLLAVSEFVAGRLRAHGVEPERIRVVYDAVPMIPRQEGERRGVVAPATGDPMKGSRLVAEAGIEVKFSSYLAEDLRNTEVFVYLTHEEGLGSAILLAMMAGAAVVASRVGGIPEVVADGRTGLLIENRPAEVAAAVRRLLDDRRLRERLAGEAREMVEKRFTIPVMTAATLACYGEVLR